MWWLKEETNRHMMLQGRTGTYIARELQVAENTVYRVLNRKQHCSKIMAIGITILCTGNYKDLETLFEERS